MALTVHRLTLRDFAASVAIAAGALAMTDVVDIDIEWSVEDQKATAGGSLQVQRTLGPQDAKITIKGWNSDNLSFADLVPKTKLTTLTTTGQTVLGAAFLAAFPPTSWCLGTTKTNGSDKPGQWTTELLPNVVGGGIT